MIVCFPLSANGMPTVNWTNHPKLVRAIHETCYVVIRTAHKRWRIYVAQVANANLLWSDSHDLLLHLLLIESSGTIDTTLAWLFELGFAGDTTHLTRPRTTTLGDAVSTNPQAV